MIYKWLTRVALTLVAFSIIGCATTKQWQGVGGSRADGVIRLGYTYKGLTSPKTDETQATNLATERCRTWGYEWARPFDLVDKTCKDDGLVTCSTWQVTQEWQCVGEGSATSK